jgi:hypothetical protein
MPGFGVHFSDKRVSSKSGRHRYRWLFTVFAAIFAVGVVPGAGAVPAFAQGASATTHSASLTRASGTATTTQGLDPRTSFCFSPTPSPSSVAVDPVKPKCERLPKSTVPGTVNPFVIKTPFAGWSAPLPGSKWVGPEPTGQDGNEGAPTFYVYDATFRFKGCAKVAGQALADNQVGVFLNGSLIADQGSTSLASNFGGPPLSFARVYPGGPAVVDFVVFDSSGPATGLDYSFTVTSLPASDCVTRASGTTTTKKGLDPRTSFCFSPKPSPKSVTVDPVKPKCKRLPKSTVPGTVHPFVIKTPFAGWSAPLAGSKWVGPQPNGRDGKEGAPNFYVYDASFTFRGCAEVNGAALADNQVGVFLNGTLLASQASSSATSNFGGPPLLFHGAYAGGLAVVDFVVFDSSGPATGLDYSFTVTPLPAADCVTGASGTTTTKKGLDPRTSFCFSPTPSPKSVTVDPVKPKCKPLPKSTVPNTVHPFVIKTPFAGWSAPLPGSKWVGPQPNGRDGNEGAPNFYVYDASFTFRGCAEVNGAALADNQVGVFLNGGPAPLAHQTSPTATSNFGGAPLLFTGSYPGGPAVLDFVVNDSSGPATGLDYSFTVTPLPATDCPPPGTSATVTGGGNFTGTASKVVLSDASNGVDVNVTCSSKGNTPASTGTGSVPSGRQDGTAPFTIGSLKTLDFRNCAGPLGPVATKLGALPYSIEADSATNTKGQTDVIVGGISASVSMTACTFTVTGSVPGFYTNSTGTLTLTSKLPVMPLEQAQLTVSNVNGCAGVIRNGDHPVLTTVVVIIIAKRGKVIIIVIIINGAAHRLLPH